MLAVNMGRVSPLPVVVSISAARVILNAKVREERTITLFDRLNWIPFYDEININKCCIIYKCLQRITPDYLNTKAHYKRQGSAP